MAVSVRLSEAAARLQREAFVFDGLTRGAPSPSVIERMLETGYSSCNWTVAGRLDSVESTLQKIATFYWVRDAHPEMVHLVTSRDDFENPALADKLKIVMGFQGAEPTERNFHFVSIYHALGIRIIQLTYNEANRLGFGCLEPDDRGLTHYGIQVVREMNRLGMVVDVTHAGIKTSLDAIAVSEDPVIFSHSSVRALRDNPRNLTDEQMKAVAERGGVVGIATFADFIDDTTKGKPTLEKFIDHIAYAADLIGIDHVGIGTDSMDTHGTEGVWWNANTKRRYPEICGGMDENMHGIEGFDLWYEFGNATEALLRRGFSEADVRKIVGGNFLRVLKAVLH